jgi:hypothetical protein
MNTKRRRKLGTSAKLAKCKNKQLPIFEQEQESGAVLGTQLRGYYVF